MLGLFPWLNVINVTIRFPGCPTLSPWASSSLLRSVRRLSAPIVMPKALASLAVSCAKVTPVSNQQSISNVPDIGTGAYSFTSCHCCMLDCVWLKLVQDGWSHGGEYAAKLGRWIGCRLYLADVAIADHTQPLPSGTHHNNEPKCVGARRVSVCAIHLQAY